MLSITVLSTLRMGIGAALSVAPRFTTTAFLVPYASSASLISRMAGIRDFAIGALLHTANRSTRTDGDSVPANGSLDPLLTKEIKTGDDYSEARRALLAGLTVDALDLIGCVWCYSDGSIPIETFGMIGGGAATFIGLGLYSLSKLPTRS